MKHKQFLALLLAAQICAAPVLLNADALHTEQTEDGERFLNEQGELSLNDKGYAVEKDTRDEAGNITSRSYFGIDENPVVIKDGYSKVEYQYDDNNRVIEG